MWQRVHEKQKTTPDDPVGDDNPDITDYWGNMQFEYARCLDGVSCEHLWSAKVRGNFATRRGSIETHWAFPTGSKQISWYVLLFSGYGESLIDYNHAENRIGIGITLQPR
jgi:phospholipase A1